MKIDAYITQNRELKIDVDLSEENAGCEASNPNVWVDGVEIFNTQSYLDGVAVFRKSFDKTGSAAFVNPFVITDHDMNIFDNIINTDNCHVTDIYNDIIVASISFQYDVAYQATHTCAELPASQTVAVYAPCSIYGDAMKQLDGCKCNDVCQDNLPYGFMYALLKKKAVDANLECGDFEKACRYYIKFYKGDSCHCVKKSCGCQNKTEEKEDVPVSVARNTTASWVNVRKNCGCHG